MRRIDANLSSAAPVSTPSLKESDYKPFSSFSFKADTVKMLGRLEKKNHVKDNCTGF